MRNSPANADLDIREITDRFVNLIGSLMKGSSAPMVSFVEQHELSFTQLKSMFVLANAAEPMPIGQIAELTGASLPAAGRAVDGLVRQGLVTRTEDPDDRRVKRIELTELGDQGMAKIYERRVEALGELLGKLEPDELTNVAAAVDALSARLGAADAADKDSPRTEDGR